MPTILRKGPYRFHFYSREPGEPPHIHVARDDFEAKFWLEPVTLAKNFGFPSHEIPRTLGIIQKNVYVLKQGWEKYHEQF
ncbi:MAG: DUF4160 domain-containing protein [bacterium]